jgi:hypothetical protein
MNRAASPPDLVAAARAAGIGDARVLTAIRATPRAGFVPGDYLAAAYRDEPIAIGHRQVTTQPSLSARMIEGLQLASGDHVLEIGTGPGFQTALLARLAATVISIERWPDLADQARRNLARHGIGNAQVLAGDGSHASLAGGGREPGRGLGDAGSGVPATAQCRWRDGGRSSAAGSASAAGRVSASSRMVVQASSAAAKDIPAAMVIATGKPAAILAGFRRRCRKAPRRGGEPQPRPSGQGAKKRC